MHKSSLTSIIVILFVFPLASQVNLAGDWSISAHSNYYGVTFNGTGYLNQTITTVSGEIRLANSPCGNDSPVTGTVSGSTLTLKLMAGFQVFTLVGTASGNTASGTFSTGAGLCTVADTGTWSAIRSSATPTIIQAIVNAASFKGGVPAGSIGTAFGTNLATGSQAASNVPLPTLLAGSSVTFDSITVDSGTVAAPLFYASSGQLNIQVPWEAETDASVTIGGLQMPYQQTGGAGINPGIFTLNQQGSGQGIVQISNTTIYAAPTGSIQGQQTRPVAKGESITIYCTGLGAVTNKPPSGSAALVNPLSTVKTSLSVMIGGVSITPSFAGLAPTFVGLYQVNAMVPSSAPSGSSVPLSIVSIPGSLSPFASNTVTIAVQ